MDVIGECFVRAILYSDNNIGERYIISIVSATAAADESS